MESELLETIGAAFGQRWQPLSTAAALGWGMFYVLFMVYAATNKDGFLFIDSANLVVHESGHLLFGWFGPTLGLWGGTLMELLVPLALACYFTVHRQTTATAFAAFFFFENFLYISVYMADARAQVLPLVTVGDPDQAGHDWFNIFSSLGQLEHDTAIAGVTKLVGWIGMVGTAAWLLYRWRADQDNNRSPDMLG
jgi:hypothetical protein